MMLRMMIAPNDKKKKKKKKGLPNNQRLAQSIHPHRYLTGSSTSLMSNEEWSPSSFMFDDKEDEGGDHRPLACANLTTSSANRTSSG
mmetsp:Transcript_43539/g.80553  ORF Transcript_43539/g.80553 Transcript_43539/m.80553 type:complete len:87 (-) Transcript_43539:664-924(-)